MPHLRAKIVDILIGIPDIIFCTYVYNHVNICFTLQRTICEISFFVLNMSSSLNKDIIIIIIIITNYKYEYNVH